MALRLDRFAGIEESTPATPRWPCWGTVLMVAQDAAATAGFFLLIDLGAPDSCQIGGIITNNDGCVLVIRYGMTQDNLLGPAGL